MCLQFFSFPFVSGEVFAVYYLSSILKLFGSQTRLNSCVISWLDGIDSTVKCVDVVVKRTSAPHHRNTFRLVLCVCACMSVCHYIAHTCMYVLCSYDYHWVRWYEKLSEPEKLTVYTVYEWVRERQTVVLDHVFVELHQSKIYSCILCMVRTHTYVPSISIDTYVKRTELLLRWECMGLLAYVDSWVYRCFGDIISTTRQKLCVECFSHAIRYNSRRDFRCAFSLDDLFDLTLHRNCDIFTWRTISQRIRVCRTEETITKERDQQMFTFLFDLLEFTWITGRINIRKEIIWWVVISENRIKKKCKHNTNRSGM